MTHSEQYEIVKQSERLYGPDWANDEMRLRKQARDVVERLMTRPFTSSASNSAVIPSTKQFRVFTVDLAPGLKRDEAVLVVEKMLRDFEESDDDC